MQTKATVKMIMPANGEQKNFSPDGLGIREKHIIFVPLWYNFKFMIMLVVSTREFRDKQKSYLDKADEGIEILIQRGKNKSYKVLLYLTMIR
jgi:hypothetical protein